MSETQENMSMLLCKGRAPDLTLRYGEHRDQVAELRVGTCAQERPLLVIIHGGFWKPEYDRVHTAAMSEALAEAGWSVLTLEYRRIPGEPDACLADVATALGQLPGQISLHDGRIILIGHSAGGHLALWAAASLDVACLQGVLALAPVADLALAEKLELGNGAVLRFLGQSAKHRPDVDPVQLPAAKVKVVIIHGNEDEVVPPVISSSYCAGAASTRRVMLDGAGHYALIDPASQAWSSILSELAYLASVDR